MSNNTNNTRAAKQENNTAREGRYRYVDSCTNFYQYPASHSFLPQRNPTHVQHLRSTIADTISISYNKYKIVWAIRARWTKIRKQPFWLSIVCPTTSHSYRDKICTLLQRRKKHNNPSVNCALVPMPNPAVQLPVSFILCAVHLAPCASRHCPTTASHGRHPLRFLIYHFNN